MNIKFVKWFGKELVTLMLIFLTVLNSVLLYDTLQTQKSYNTKMMELILTISENQVKIEELEEEIKKAEKRQHELENKVKKMSADGWKKAGDFYLTAYCDCAACQEQWVGTTATGEKPTPGDTIAVDPEVIPLGSKVKIDGRVYTAEDTGGAIKGNRIDVLLGSHIETRSFKNRYEAVYVKTI